MRTLIVWVVLLITSAAQAEQTLLAVFAHPDDESTVAPIIARYVREGARVHIAIATDGRYGFQEHAGIPAGDALAAARDEEMICAAEALGAELTHFDYHDQLKAREGYDGHIPHVRALQMDVAALIDYLEPDAIITWGPDGGSNHMDHRLIGDIVTGAFLARDRGDEMSLYFYGTPASHFDDAEARARAGVADDYLATRITYSQDDLDAAIKSLRCHESQFSPQTMEGMIASRRDRDRVVYLRRFESQQKPLDSVFGN